MPSDDRTTDRLTDGAQVDEGSDSPPGKGAELAETRAFITQRMQQLAVNAMKIYESALNPNGAPRNIQTQLMAARDVVEMLTEGKLQPAVVKQAKPAAVVDLAKMSEEIRLAKQAERRRA